MGDAYRRVRYPTMPPPVTGERLLELQRKARETAAANAREAEKAKARASKASKTDSEVPKTPSRSRRSRKRVPTEEEEEEEPVFEGARNVESVHTRDRGYATSTRVQRAGYALGNVDRTGDCLFDSMAHAIDRGSWPVAEDDPLAAEHEASRVACETVKEILQSLTQNEQFLRLLGTGLIASKEAYRAFVAWAIAYSDIPGAVAQRDAIFSMAVYDEEVESEPTTTKELKAMVAYDGRGNLDHDALADGLNKRGRYGNEVDLSILRCLLPVHIVQVTENNTVNLRPREELCEYPTEDLPFIVLAQRVLSRVPHFQPICTKGPHARCIYSRRGVIELLTAMRLDETQINKLRLI